MTSLIQISSQLDIKNTTLLYELFFGKDENGYSIYVF